MMYYDERAMNGKYSDNRKNKITTLYKLSSYNYTILYSLKIGNFMERKAVIHRKLNEWWEEVPWKYLHACPIDD